VRQKKHFSVRKCAPEGRALQRTASFLEQVIYYWFEAEAAREAAAMD
jgi:hypothetical protein